MLRLPHRRVEQPIIPLRLFASRTFSLVTSVGLLVGAAMFGSIVFLPVFFQLVTGATATEAGLLLTPLMGGVILSSTLSGRIITRTGRYKAHPVTGTVLVAAALGAATATVGFSRTLGGSIGSALLSAVMAAGLSARLAVLARWPA